MNQHQSHQHHGHDHEMLQTKMGDSSSFSSASTHQLHERMVGVKGQLVKVFSKGDKSFNLAVRHGFPVMVHADSDDPTQLWTKDLTYGNTSKDNYGCPAFALVNEATGLALKLPKQAGQPVRTVEYRPAMRDEDILFTESQDFGEGFHTLRKACDTLLNMSIAHEEEEKKSGFFHHSHKPSNLIREGSSLTLDTWHKDDLQLWKMFPLS